MRTYTGAVHIHSDRSDGGGSLSDIIAAAKRAQIDFVILTDHGTRGYAHTDREGWHDGVLVLCGEEVTTPEGHFLAFETRDDIGEQSSLEPAIASARQQYGSVVSIHHQLPSLGPEATVVPPPVPLEKADILEVWSMQDEFLARVQPKYFIPAAAKPEKLIMGPPRNLLRQWDRELDERRLPALAGLNVHARKEPLLEWKVLFPYQTAFQSLVTCIVGHDLPAVSVRARDLVWTALREGRCYMANRSVASEKGFHFEYHDANGRVRQMGEEVPYDSKGRFYVRLEQHAEVVLRHNGQPYFWVTTRETTFPVVSPGSYRIEVYLNRRTWILSNAIRLVDEEGVIQPTVSDVT